MKSLTKIVTDTKRGMGAMRQVTLDVISLVTATGRTIFTITQNAIERRDVKIISPYGIASSGVEGMQAQILCNDTIDSISMVGVYDPDRPDVGPGETIMYSAHGQRIFMRSDGEVVFLNAGAKQVTLTEIYNHIHGV